MDCQGPVPGHQADCSTEPMLSHQADTSQVTGSHELSHLCKRVTAMYRLVHRNVQKNSNQQQATVLLYNSKLSHCLTNFGECAFSNAGLSAWNALPTHICDIPNSDSFRKLLKSHFLA